MGIGGDLFCGSLLSLFSAFCQVAALEIHARCSLLEVQFLLWGFYCWLPLVCAFYQTWLVIWVLIHGKQSGDNVAIWCRCPTASYMEQSLLIWSNGWNARPECWDRDWADESSFPHIRRHFRKRRCMKSKLSRLSATLLSVVSENWQPTLFLLPRWPGSGQSSKCDSGDLTG